MRRSVLVACSTASPAIRLLSCTCRPTSVTEADSSWAADATDRTLDEASSEAVVTTPESCSVVSAVLVKLDAAASRQAEADDTVLTTPPTAASNLSARPCIASLRSASARARASF